MLAVLPHAVHDSSERHEFRLTLFDNHAVTSLESNAISMDRALVRGAVTVSTQSKCCGYLPRYDLTASTVDIPSSHPLNHVAILSPALIIDPSCVIHRRTNTYRPNLPAARGSRTVPRD